MKWVLLLMIGLLVGCGVSNHSGTSNTLSFKWTGDGNPLVPVCSLGVNKNCKSSIDVEDLTTSVIVNLPITQTNYTVSDNTHKYRIRTSGYDKDGNVIHSLWEPVN